MGILKLEGKQQVGENKSLPKKPKQTEHSTANFCNNLLDISLEEKLLLAGVEKQVTCCSSWTWPKLMYKQVTIHTPT